MELLTKIERGVAKQHGLKIEEVHVSATKVHEKGFNFDDVRLIHGAWRNETNPDICKGFQRTGCFGVPHQGQAQCCKIGSSCFLILSKFFSFVGNFVCKLGGALGSRWGLCEFVVWLLFEDYCLI